MASSALRRSLPRHTSLRRSIPPHLPSAAAGAFRRSFQSGDGESLEEFDERLFGSKNKEEGSLYKKFDRAEDASKRYGMGSGMGGFLGFGDRSSSGSSMGGFPGFGDRSSSGSSMGGFPGFGDRSSSGSDMGGFPGFSDRSSSGSSMGGGFPGFGDRSSSGSSMGGFPGFGDRSSSGSDMGGFPGLSDRSSSGSSMGGGFAGFGDRSSSWSAMSGLGAFSETSSSGSMGFFDSSNDTIKKMLGDAARNFQMDDDDDDDDEWEEDDFEFRPDVQWRRGSTYSTRDLDLTKPAAAKNPPRRQFETTTAEVLKKADFRNVRFLSHFLTEAGIIIKRSQTRISAKAQRKIAREIKTARAFGLMPFTTMGRRPFIFGRSAEEHYSEEEYFAFGKQRDGEPVEDNGDEEPNVEAA